MSSPTASTRFFFTSYEDSRNQFLMLTKDAVIKEAIPIPDLGGKGHLKGMSGEGLYIDIAVFGNVKNPENLLLHTAGVHGVEGFCGSAIQLKCLQDYFVYPSRGSESFNKGTTAIVFIHCLNPWGMSFHRRVNSNNVDLNRNFFYEELVDAIPEKTKKSCYEIRGTDLRYGPLDDLLNPKYDDLGYFDTISFYFDGIYKFLSHGYSSFKQTIFEGQYKYPKGLFFGGKQLEDEPRIVLSWMTRFLTKTIDSKNLKRIYHVDVHTGMGDYAETLLVVERDLDDEFASLFGNKVYPLTREENIPYPQKEFSAFIANGNVGSAFQELSTRLGIEYYGICQEFGTYSTPSVLRALRFENAAFQKYGEKLARTHPAKMNLLETFYPASCIYWKAKTLKGGQDLFKKCLDFAEARGSKGPSDVKVDVKANVVPPVKYEGNK